MEINTVENQVEFDVFKTIKVIETDDFLNDIFREDYPELSYNMLYTMAKNDTISNDLMNKLKEIFEYCILKSKNPLKKYCSISNELEKSVDKKNKLPKHYGKKRVLEDIKSNNGATELDTAMLALNNLRNIYSKLKNRGIKDKINGTNLLSGTECRDIVATVRIVENRLNSILKK
jgi:hypothetical protein